MKCELKKLPVHLAFIIDGNGRWAKERGLTRSMGHKAGFDKLEKMIKETFYKYGIPNLSVYCFSTENWNRPDKEVNYLIGIFRKYVNLDWKDKYPDVKVNFCGDLTRFPKDICDRAMDVMRETSVNTKYTLNLCLNYSGQEDIVYAINNIIAEGIEKVDREVVASHLYTKGQPPVDYCIRTSGEYRLSNFMLWQLAYAELYFPKVYWPAFSSKDLKEALLEYQCRDRRFGAIDKNDTKKGNKKSR